MKRTGWKSVVVLAALIVVAAAWMARRHGPAERLAGRYRQICAIAGDNVKSPSRGVDRMGAFFAVHGSEMLRDYGDLVSSIERIRDDRRHDAEAREAGRIINAPLHECAETLQRFGEAVEADEEATAKLSRGFERLGRTLQFLFGDAAAHDWRSLLRRF
jgi:hypothetical protein